jgi:hypothetical protein
MKKTLKKFKKMREILEMNISNRFKVEKDSKNSAMSNLKSYYSCEVTTAHIYNLTLRGNSVF